MVTDQNPQAELDDFHRALLLKLISDGLGWRTAAQCIGLDPNAVVYAAEHDRRFARDLLLAERALDREGVQRLLAAARNPRHWRAAAWLLERLNPDDYGRKRTRQPALDRRTVDQLADAFVALVRKLPPESGRRTLAKLEAICVKISTEVPEEKKPR